MHESDDPGAWPAFVDLLAATALIFLVLFAVVALPLMGRAQELRGVETALERLQDQLRLELATQPVSVERRASFLFLRIEGDATFPRDAASLATLQPEGKRILREMARVVRERGMMEDVFQFQVVGHASREGAATLNWFLSAARAAAVAQFLVDSVGLDPCKVSAVGRSRYYPVDGPAALGRIDPRDRRIEIEVLPRFASDSLQEDLLRQCAP